jgi:hypothetical protein
MNGGITSTAKVAGLFTMPSMSEPVPDAASYGTQLYIGRTRIYRLPVFLSLDELVNPHIAIVGATGTGKTYLLKSLIARFALVQRNAVLLIDWNGEYAELTEALGGKVIADGVQTTGKSPLQAMLRSLVTRNCRHAVVNVCLAGIKGEPERRAAAAQALHELVRAMVGTALGRKTDIMVVIDEAWKLAGRVGELSQLFREGRKYGFAVAIATQLTGDMDASILANAACRFVFRLTGSGSAAELGAAGLNSGTEALERLGVGSCIMSMATMGGHAEEFTVDRVDGFELREYSIIGDNMSIGISNQRLDGLLKMLDAGAAAKARLREAISSSRGTLHLVELTGTMAKAGFSRAEIVWFLRETGVDDMSIALACEASASALIESGANDR